MEALLPEVPPTSISAACQRPFNPTPPRRRVGMLSGCVQQVFFPHVNAATARVLAAEGCEVIIPREQPCCGALMLHSGLEDEAQRLAKKMIAAFEAANVDTIVINSAGCGSTMKEYGYLLRDDPPGPHAPRPFPPNAKTSPKFSASSSRRLRAILSTCASPITMPVTSSTRRGYMTSRADCSPESPVSRSPRFPKPRSAAVRPASTICCSPKLPINSATAKWTTSSTTKRQAVISANPGCLLQLMNGLRRRGIKAMPAFHMVELLDASIRGVPASELVSHGTFDKRPAP